MSAAAPPPAYMIQSTQPSVVLGSISPPTAAQEKRERTCSKAFKITGWLQVSLGIVTVIFGIVAIIIKAWFSYYATPIWMGLLFFITTGVLGVLASCKKKKGLRVAYMVMCIISSAAAFSLMFTCIAMAVSEDTQWWYRQYGDYIHVCNPGEYHQVVYNCAHKFAGRQVVDALMALAAFVEAVVTIMGAAYCCYAVCDSCCNQTPATTAYYTTTGTATYPVGHSAGQVYVQVPQTTYIVPQGPGMVATNPGVPMHIAHPAPAGNPQYPAQQYTQVPTGPPPNMGPNQAPPYDAQPTAPPDTWGLYSKS